MEGDLGNCCGDENVQYFYPRPPGGGRRELITEFVSSGKISIHALRVEGDAIGTGLLEQHSYISIHALRVEGDIINTAFDATQSVFLSTPSGWRATWQLRQAGNACEFLSTPSGWRATRASHSCKGSARYFYPRPPGGGRPASARIKKEPSDFYPRPPGGGRPQPACCRRAACRISIHALRVEGDKKRGGWLQSL